MQQRKITSCKGYLWITDETIVIYSTNIRSKVDIWLTDANKPNIPIHYRWNNILRKYEIGYKTNRFMTPSS